MRLGVLFSGGKDSCASLLYAKMHDHDVSCLLSIVSQNPHSYLFHTPNIDKTRLQAQAMNIPLLTQETRGEKEEELVDLVILLKAAKEQYYIEGVVTGAIHSVYQATRIQKVCKELGLWCFNPLWQRDSLEHVRLLAAQGFEMKISAIAAYPLDATWLGKNIDEKTIQELDVLSQKHQVNPAGEGGEYESFVTFAPLWTKEIMVTKASLAYENHAGLWHVEDAKLVQRTSQTREEVKKHIAHIHALQTTKDAHSEKILLVSTCKESFSEMEFVEPLARILEYKCKIVSYRKVSEEDLLASERVIICGTALQDDEFLSYQDSFSWLATYNKPVLGICAGFHIMMLHEYAKEGLHIKEHTQIGVEKLEDNPWNITEAYFLHHNGCATKDDVFIKPFLYDEKKKLYAVLFHPEVRSESVIKDFLKVQ